MTVDDTPIDYVLVEPTAGNPYPVDSTYHQCCRSIGRHSTACRAGELDEYTAAFRRRIHQLMERVTPADLNGYEAAQIIHALLTAADRLDRSHR